MIFYWLRLCNREWHLLRLTEVREKIYPQAKCRDPYKQDWIVFIKSDWRGFFRLSWVPLRELFCWGGIVIFVFCLPVRMDNLNSTKTRIQDFCFRVYPRTRMSAHEDFDFSFSFFVAYKEWPYRWYKWGKNEFLVSRMCLLTSFCPKTRQETIRVS